LRRGKFITIEGGEGVGKSTNIATLKETLEASGIRLVCTREPGGTPFSEQIRSVLLEQREESVEPVAELLLMFAARVQHYRQVIEPALEQGIWVLCDRFTDASVAYQGFGRGLGQAFVQALNELVLDGGCPDLTLLLDLKPETGRERIGERGQLDRFEVEQSAFFERIRAGYLTLAKQEPERFRVIDASASLEEVGAAIQRVIRDYLVSEGLHHR